MLEKYWNEENKKLKRKKDDLTYFYHLFGSNFFT